MSSMEYLQIMHIAMLESVMCDVIKICLKGGMRGEVGKETPNKEMDLDVFL